MNPRGAAKDFVLDTSAFIAYVAGEPGHDKVKAIFDSAESVKMSEISMMEIYYVYLRQGGKDEAERILKLCPKLGVTWEKVEREVLLRGAQFKATYHLSLADAIIAGTAQGLGATLVHRDPELAALSKELALLALPPKK